ncbi:MAG: right-handed parallel beta-helix repeat-containing protein [Kiritimatiellae bacterium]|jgi:hypothetical protein|nr:right-handed parallel beta-helix repeat-containing protein [Kiritimatiellia bacterium]
MRRTCTCFMVMATVAVQAGEIFIVPFEKASEDKQDGSKKNPFTSLVQARDAIRTAKKAGSQEPWNVHLKKGIYPVSETIVFEPADSGTADAPVIYKGAGSKTIISGGITLTGWKEIEDGTWEADLPLNPDGSPLYFEALYVNNRRAVRSRHPDTGFLNPEDVTQTGLDGKATKKGPAKAELTAKSGELDLIRKIPQNELKYAQVIVHHKWDTTRRIITGFDAATGTISTQGGIWKSWNKWQKSSMYYVENLRSAFNQPGEWFYDGVNKKVKYHPLPKERLNRSELIAPRPGLIALIHFKGDIKNKTFVKNIRFENMALFYTDSPRRKDQLEKAGFTKEFIGDLNKPGPTQLEPMQAAARTEPAIQADGAHNITFKECELSHIGEYGIWFRSGCISNRFQNCIISDLGSGGIRLGATGSEGCKPPAAGVSTNTSPWCSAYNVVDNCIIKSGGRFHASGVAVWIGSSADNQITHNDISDFYYTGVSVGWVWGYSGSFAQRNSICWNRIYNIGQKALGDMGGVYTLGTSFGTKICNNVIYDIDSYTYGGWGLYTDEGSEGILMENNLVYNTKDGSFHQHYGRNNIIRNNILCDSREYQVAATRKEKHCSFIFERNIVCWDKGPVFKPHTTEKQVEWKDNIWYMSSGPIDFEGKTFAEWQKSGCDKDGFEADPQFENPSKCNFKIHSGSPAEKIGFVEFDYNKAGNYNKQKSWKWSLLNLFR